MTNSLLQRAVRSPGHNKMVEIFGRGRRRLRIQVGKRSTPRRSSRPATRSCNSQLYFRASVISSVLHKGHDASAALCFRCPSPWYHIWDHDVSPGEAFEVGMAPLIGDTIDRREIDINQLSEPDHRIT